MGEIVNADKRGIRRLEYFGWNLLVALIFALPFYWLESGKGPSEPTLYLLIYGWYGLITGILVEKRVKNIGFEFKESFQDRQDGLRLIAGGAVLAFLLIGASVWIEATGKYSDSFLIIPVAAVLLIASILSIPFGLYLLFAPENHKLSYKISSERKKLERELKSIQDASEIERLRHELKKLKNAE